MEDWQGAVLVVGLPWATGIGFILHHAGFASRKGNAGASFAGSNNAGRGVLQAFLAHARCIRRWLARATISFGRFNWHGARILLRLRRGVGLARLSVAAADAVWLAPSTVAQRPCLGHLALSFHHVDWLRTRSRDPISVHVYVADRFVWSLHRLAAIGIRECMGRRDGTRLLQRVCAEFLRSLL